MDGDGFATPLAGRASMAGVYDASAPLDGLRFVRAMMEAGAAEEVLLRGHHRDLGNRVPGLQRARQKKTLNPLSISAR